jgi:superfamily II DNA or RNA helicase/GNAT superfamily N-acetyltransferase
MTAQPFQFALNAEKYQLEDWQQVAVAKWNDSRHPSRGPRHGILHVYTGAGKSVLAAGCMVEVAKTQPSTKFAIVVPTEALARQWAEVLPKMTNLPRARVGQVGGGENDDFEGKDVLVFVLQSAQRVDEGRSRLARACSGHKVMLVVDECHKSGARGAQRIFDAATCARLGLSATPSREDADNKDIYGRTLPVNKQPHGKELGPICYIRSLQDGIREGCLPRYEIHHHGVSLAASERDGYSSCEKEITKRRKAVTEAGGDPNRYEGYKSGRLPCSTIVRTAAIALELAYIQRKQFLYQASERLRVTRLLLEQAFNDPEPPKGALLFNERVGDDAGEEGDFGAERLATLLRKDAEEGCLPFGSHAIAVEHARLARDERDASIEGLRNGSVKILVSVKALQEGLDIPDVGMGVSVASTASCRQRIQTMGRILRPPRDANGKRLDPANHPIKQLHLIYVRNTPDEQIYRNFDWGDLMRPELNHWLVWGDGEDEPTTGDELKNKVLPEAEAWGLVERSPKRPAPWFGPQVGLSLSWRHQGVSVAGSDVPIENAGEVAAVLGNLNIPLGRVLVTPELGVVLTWSSTVNSDGKREPVAWGRTSVQVADHEVQPVQPLEGGAPAPLELADVEHAVIGLTDIERGRESRAKDLEIDFRGWWYDIVQHGCLAWVGGDLDTVEAAVSVLESRRRASVGVALLKALLEAPDKTGYFDSDPFRMEHALKASVAGAATTAGRLDVLGSIHDEFDRLAGVNGRNKFAALANALAILGGKTRDILVTDDD